MKSLFKNKIFTTVLCSAIIFSLMFIFSLYIKKNLKLFEQINSSNFSNNGHIPTELKDNANKYIDEYLNNNPRKLSDMGPYSTYKNFLYCKDHTLYSDNPKIKLDKQGIPTVKYPDGKYHYNAVTDSQYALALYSDYLDTQDESLKEAFLNAADFLYTLQSKDGAFRYDFEWKNFNSGEKYSIGWVSSMAQGHALSVYSRAYYISKDTKYIEYGNKVFDFLLVPKEKGGTMTTLKDLNERYKDNIFFEEYVSTPNSYTLNGYMFTLLGIHDWATLENDYPELKINKNAKYYFDEGIESLKIVLPYYDIGGFSSYDLGHVTFKTNGHIVPSYHTTHIVELSNLYSITGDKTIQAYQLLWTGYINNYKIKKYISYVPYIIMYAFAI